MKFTYFLPKQKFGDTVPILELIGEAYGPYIREFTDAPALGLRIHVNVFIPHDAASALNLVPLRG